MEEFPSNSHESKEKPKVLKSSVSGAKIKKRSEVSKFAEVFLAEDVSSVKSYILMDVLVPAIKKAISDIVTNGIDMILYGEDGSPSRSKNATTSKISYTPYYKLSSNSHKEQRSTPSRPKTVYDYDDVEFETKGAAAKFLQDMDDVIREYGMISLADYYDLARVTSEYTTQKYGWTDLREAKVVRSGGGYIIKLPKPSPLN